MWILEYLLKYVSLTSNHKSQARITITNVNIFWKRFHTHTQKKPQKKQNKKTSRINSEQIRTLSKVHMTKKRQLQKCLINDSYFQNKTQVTQEFGDRTQKNEVTKQNFLIIDASKI